MFTVCFTGHRPIEFGGWEVECPENVKMWLNEYIDKIINLKKEVTFISGAAQGIDQWAAEIVLEKKEKNPNVKLTMAIPYIDFGNNWPQRAKDKLKSINDRADKIVFVYDSTFTGSYLLQLRNEWMVDHSHLVLAVWNGSLGGTRNCVMDATKKQVPIIRFNPINGETTKRK